MRVRSSGASASCGSVADASGLAGVSQSTRGPRGMIRPGDWFGEVALAMGVPRTATVTTMTPCVVASCDRATFDELLRPLFADDED